MDKNILKSQEGVALIVALIILLVLTLIGISAISTSTFETSLSGNERVATDAFYIAEAGVQRAINQLPNTTAIARTQLGQSLNQSYYWSGSPADRNSPKDLIALGKYPRTGFSAETFEFQFYQVDATGQSFGATKQIEVQASAGPYGAGTNY
jgi:type IV pilus assembly protein PilX